MRASVALTELFAHLDVEPEEWRDDKVINRQQKRQRAGAVPSLAALRQFLEMANEN